MAPVCLGEGEGVFFPAPSSLAHLARPSLAPLLTPPFVLAALSAAIMACSAALANAGIEQRDLLVGATVAVLGDADGPLVVDPTHEEMKMNVRRCTAQRRGDQRIPAASNAPFLSSIIHLTHTHPWRSRWRP